MTYSGGNPFGHDPEAVYQDADIEQAMWEQKANEIEIEREREALAREEEAERELDEAYCQEQSRIFNEGGAPLGPMTRQGRENS